MDDGVDNGDWKKALGGGHFEEGNYSSRAYQLSFPADPSLVGSVVCLSVIPPI